MLKKLLVFAVTLAWAGIGLFAQNAKYSDLLKKAKDAEKNKEYVYALGYYYDAMETVLNDNTINISEASAGYEKLSAIIKSGKPGLDNYNAFTLHDEWINLLKNAEKYFTEYPYYGIEIGKLQQEGLDFNTRTASYSVKISYFISNKGDDLLNILKKGLESDSAKDWKDIPYDWPKSSVCKNYSNVIDAYKKEKIALFARTHSDVSKYGMITPDDVTEPAFYIGGTYTGSDGYNIVLGIYDKTGKKIFESKTLNPSEIPERKFIFSGISSDFMGIIDAGEYEIKPISVYLTYGVARQRNVLDERSSYAYIATTLEKNSINLEKIDFAICENAPKPYIPRIAPAISFANSLYTNEYMDKEYMAKINSTLEAAKYETTQGLYSLIIGKNPSTYYENPATEEEQWARPVENISWYEAVIFCNELTKKYMDENDCVYTISNIQRDEKSITKADVACDLTKKGYRLPTEEEWKQAAGSACNEEFSQVAWYKSNSGTTIIRVEEHGKKFNKTISGMTHEVGKKKANEFGLFDVIGNVREWCWSDDDSFAPYYGGDCQDFEDRRGGINKGTYSQTSGYKQNNFTTVGFRVVRTRIPTDAEKTEMNAKAAAEKKAADKNAKKEKAKTFFGF